MAEHSLEFLEDNRNTFNLIKDGLKKIESRVARPLYQDIREDDFIIFSCGNDKFTKRVSRVNHFKTLDDMLQKFNVQEINPSLNTVDELKESYLSYPNYKENLEKYGIFVFELEN